MPRSNEEAAQGTHQRRRVYTHRETLHDPPPFAFRGTLEDARISPGRRTLQMAARLAPRHRRGEARRCATHTSIHCARVSRDACTLATTLSTLS